MTKYIVFIAISQDGFIADSNGSIDFLNKINVIGDAGYTEFYKKIDSLIFGSKTYEVIKNFNLVKWPYEGKKQWVLTQNVKKYKNHNDIEFVNMKVNDLASKIKNKNVWVMGGANVINQFIKNDLIDEMHISNANIKLHNGIKLFDSNSIYEKFKIIDTKKYGDITTIIYSKK